MVIPLTVDGDLVFVRQHRHNPKSQVLEFLLLRRRRTGQVIHVGSVESRRRREVMSQSTTRHEQHAKSVDEDVVGPRARQPAHKEGVRPRQPVGRPTDDGGVGPDEPDEAEFELIGDDDLGAADLGPAAPNVVDPDVASERIRKISRES
jgi:hypothetical protein